MFIRNIIREVIKVKLVVGLGNPGDEYKNTRHNIGFMFLDYVTNNANFVVNKKFNAMEYETVINGEKVLFIKPLTYMNLSGETVIKYVNFYKIQLNDVLIIQDDLDMDIGRYKLMFKHSAGGHNGIKSIISCLGSSEFLRLKIGISKTDNDTINYVLGKFNNNEMKILSNVFYELKYFIDDYICMNRDILMGKYNTKEKNN